jgi:hypothetical protein
VLSGAPLAAGGTAKPQTTTQTAVKIAESILIECQPWSYGQCRTNRDNCYNSRRFVPLH